MPDNWIPETRNRLARRRARKPDTKAGQLWALWPEIKAALAEGQSIRTVLGWLEEDAGIVVSPAVSPATSAGIESGKLRNGSEEAARSFARAHDARTKSVSTPVPASARSERKDSAANSPVLSESDPMARTMAALRKRRFESARRIRTAIPRR